MPTKTDAELARIQSRHHHQEEPFILAEKEWQRRLMREQHKLNKRVALIAACCSGLFGLLGVLIGKYL